MSLAALLVLADSRLPVGGHVHSGGVEEAITAGLVGDVATVAAYLRRRIRTHGLVTASIAAAVSDGRLTLPAADRETDARTPAPAARQSSRAQGRGLARLARRIWPEGRPDLPDTWGSLGLTPHLAVASGLVGRLAGLSAQQTAVAVVYSTMTGTATAAQRLLALDPADVAALTFEFAELCEATADDAIQDIADLSDPLLDVLAQRHAGRDRPLFSS